MDLRKVVEMFRRVGASCRKVRGEDRYVCWKGDARAVIGRDGVVIKNIGDFRLEYSDFAPEGYRFEGDFLEDVREATGADDAWIEVEPSPTTWISLKFGMDKVGHAVEVFKKMADHDMHVSITHIRGEVRTYMDEEQVPPRKWLEAFGE